MNNVTRTLEVYIVKLRISDCEFPSLVDMGHTHDQMENLSLLLHSLPCNFEI